VTASSFAHRSLPSSSKKASVAASFALAIPHDRAALVVDDHGDALVVPAVAQLVHTDETKTVERVAGPEPRHYPLDDAANRGPRDAHHVAERLVGPLREVATGCSKSYVNQDCGAATAPARRSRGIAGSAPDGSHSGATSASLPRPGVSSGGPRA
jgi:hypothetical protein